MLLQRGGLFAGGLIFGWNALALMLKAQGNYNGQCPQGSAGELIVAAVAIQHEATRGAGT